MRFTRRLDIEIVVQATSKGVINPQGAGAVTDPREKTDVSLKPGLIIAAEQRRAPRNGRRRARAPRGRLRLRKLPCGAGRTLTKTLALLIEPTLEFRCLRQKEAGQQVSPVHLQGILDTLFA